MINRFLNHVTKLQEEEQMIAFNKVSDCMRIIQQRYIGSKSFEKKKRIKEEGQNIGLAFTELSDEERQLQTDTLFSSALNRYSVERVGTFLDVQMGNDEKIRMKEKQLRTKEEALMYAAAMLYAKNNEFPYEIHLSEDVVSTDIAEISDIVISKK